MSLSIKDISEEIYEGRISFWLTRYLRRRDREARIDRGPANDLKNLHLVYGDVMCVVDSEGMLPLLPRLDRTLENCFYRVVLAEGCGHRKE